MYLTQSIRLYTCVVAYTILVTELSDNIQNLRSLYSTAMDFKPQNL